MIYAKFNDKGYISTFITKEEVKKLGENFDFKDYVLVPNLNCRLVNGSIIDETEKVLNQDRIRELDNWFKIDYSTYEQMFNRRKTLGIEDTIVDDFRNKTYHNLIELYEEAEVVAGEIRELRENNSAKIQNSLDKSVN